MSRITTPLVALALCLTLICLTLPRARASAPDSLGKEVKQQESCATCPAGAPGTRDKWVNSLATAGRRTQQMPFAAVQRSVFDGARVNMVGTANGSLVFAVTDLKISGLMPVAFQRVYASDRAQDRGLGAGWSFAYDDRVRVEGDAAVMSTGDGGEMAFRRDGESRRFVLRTPEPGPHQSFDEAADGTLVESVAGLTRTYRKVGGEYRLSLISDPNGNAISISFDRKGNISRVDGGGGRSLKLGWSVGKQQRLLSVTDNAGRRASFESRGGSLSSVVDQAGSRWTYTYEGGRLTEAADPVGRVVLRARYDAQGRAVESGDAVGSHRFEYEENAPGRTVLTDPMGAKTSFTHDALGAVSSVTDDEGLTATVEYDEAHLPTRVSDTAGNQQTFAVEAVGKGGAAAQAAGGVAYTYDARGNVLSARSGNPATSYRAVRNGRGQPVKLMAESGREMTFEYDAAGNETAFTYSDVGRFERSYDGAGRKISERMPSGRSLGYKYDAHGQVARVTDNSARSLAIERDASGMIAKIMTDDSTQVRVTRDAAGRPTRLDFPDGKSRQYAYDARGALTYYRDAQGRQYQMSYSRVGRLQKVDKSDGVTLHYRYGRDGRVASVSREVRGRVPGFVNAGFNFLPRPPARDYETEEGCFMVFDGFGVWYNMCDPYSYYLDADLIVETWYEYARGSAPLHGVPNPPNDCLRFKFAACQRTWDSCLSDVSEGGSYALIACFAITGGAGFAICMAAIALAYVNGVRKCDAALDACRLEAQAECPNT